MYYKNLLRPILATVLVMLMATGIAFGRGEPIRSGSNLPSYYPSSFQATGILSETSTGAGLIISGLSYTLSMNVLIHTTSTEFSSRYALSAGKEVGFSFSDNGGSRTVSEIWVLPGGTVLLK